MIYKPVIIVAGEPNIFFEIFFKALKSKKFKVNCSNCIIKDNAASNEKANLKKNKLKAS